LGIKRGRMRFVLQFLHDRKERGTIEMRGETSPHEGDREIMG
jgi:hypothetical protein